MRRRVIKILAITLMAFAMLVVALWWRSYRIADYAGHFDGRGGGWWITNHRGTIIINVDRVGFDSTRHFYYETVIRPMPWETGESSFSAEFNNNGNNMVTFPHWLALVVFGIASILLFRSACRRNINKRGFEVIAGCH